MCGGCKNDACETPVNGERCGICEKCKKRTERKRSNDVEDRRGKHFCVRCCECLCRCFESPAKCSNPIEGRKCATDWKRGYFRAQGDARGSVLTSYQEAEKHAEASKNVKDEKRFRNIRRSLELALNDVSLLGKQDIKSIGFFIRWMKFNCCKRGKCCSIGTQLKDGSNAFARSLMLFMGVWGFSIVFAMASCIVYWNEFHQYLTEGPWATHKLMIWLILSALTITAVHILCTTLYNITGVYYKALAAMRICEDFKYLLYSDEMKEDEFIFEEIEATRAWCDLRSYVVREVLPCYNEVTNPIISLLVASVFCFTFAWIYQLLAIFERSPQKLFESIMVDNVRFVAFAFTAFLVIATLMVLNWVLQPYSRQYVHIDIVKDKKTELIFKYKELCVESAKKNKDTEVPNLKKNPKVENYKAIVEIYDHLIAEMTELHSAPQVLGMNLDEAKLAAIRGYILSVVALLIGSLFGSYVEEYDELLN